ncbi:hypothetical protein JCM10213_002234 [Rhodosporidiobolus nylandii]
MDDEDRHRGATLSILAPLSYIGFLVVSLSLFSKIYRRRQAIKPTTEPWFPPHKSRDIYVSLLSLDPPPPRPILVAALLRRAMDDVKLIWSVRDAKTSLTTLLQKGQIGDELWERFLEAEKELEAEIVEVVGEANTFEPGYGQKIFNVASDMVSHERWKDVYAGVAKKREEENAKLTSTAPPTPLLAPTTYLTPSSLSLSASNPLPAAGTTPAPTGAPAPLPQADAPPETPAPAAPAAAVVAEPAAKAEEEEEKPAAAPSPASAPEVPASPPAPSAPATPSGTPKKTPVKGGKGKRKPPVKGGR